MDISLNIKRFFYFPNINRYLISPGKLIINRIDDTNIIILFNPLREASLYQELHLMCTWSLFVLAACEAARTSNFVHHHFILCLLAIIPIAFLYICLPSVSAT